MLSIYVQAVICLVVGAVIASLTIPWIHRKKLIGDRFFTATMNRNKEDYYVIEMFPSYITMREGLCAKNKREMFFRKLEKLIDDLSVYPHNSKFEVVTHEIVEKWLIANEKVEIIYTKEKNKRWYFLRKLMILNFSRPLFKKIQFKEIHFVFK